MPASTSWCPKALPPGSIYAEPPGVAHFARTGDSAVVVQITG